MSDLILSIKSSFFYFRFYLLSLSIWYALDYNKNFTKNYLNLLIIVQIILILDAFIQYKFGTNILGWEKFHPHRVSGFFGDELVLGSYLARFLPLTVGLYVFVNYQKFDAKKTIILFFLILIIYLGISISGDRTAFYLSLIFLPFLFTLKNIKYLKKKVYPLAISFFIIFCILILNSENVKNRLFNSTFNSMISFAGEENTKINFTLFSHNHEVHFKTAANMFLDNKFFGVGIKQYRVFCKNEKYFVNRHSCVTHPHNIYVQFLAELGIVGFSFLFVFFIYVVLKLFKNFFKNKNNSMILFNYIILSGLFINLFPFAPSGNFFNNWMSMIYFCPLGFYLYSQKKI